MSDLAETYATACGLHLYKPDMVDTFYPLEHPVNKTILIHAFAGATVNQNGQVVATFPAKIYDHFNEVVTILKPVVEAAGYRLYQIGGPSEPGLGGIESLVGKTTRQQCAYLVRNCALLIGNDSLWAHVRGASDGAQVHIYGSTSKPHFPHWRHPEKCILIESHRGGGKPSYVAAESPKWINAIPPEKIANAAISILGLSPLSTRQSLFFGESYHQSVLELVPDVVVNPGVQVPGALVVRMDYAPETADGFARAQDALVSNLRIRPCAIITDREINVNILAQLKSAVAALRVEVDRISPEWIKVVKRLGLQTAFFSNEADREKLSALRLKLYDACLFDYYSAPTHADFLKASTVYLNKEIDSPVIDDRLHFTTKKFLLSADKVYLSKAHWLAGQHTAGTHENVGKVIDTPIFWEEQAHAYVYRQ